MRKSPIVRAQLPAPRKENVIYHRDARPEPNGSTEHPIEGDIWIDSSVGGHLYRWHNGAWHEDKDALDS